MDVLASAEFRKVYARLTAPTLVTVNGHVIGEWTPGPTSNTEATMPPATLTASTPQARRDELLRRINRPR